MKRMIDVDSTLATIRNDLAMNRFDDRELNILSSLLNIFLGFVEIHRKEKKQLEDDIEDAVTNCGIDFDKIAEEIEEDLNGQEDKKE